MTFLSRRLFSLPAVRLKAGYDSMRLHSSQLIVANDITNGPDMFKSLKGPSGIVSVEDDSGISLGTGFYNHTSLMRVRMLPNAYLATTSAQSNHSEVLEVLETNLRSALSYRESCHSQPFYRLSNGESDGLPGVLIDRFDSVIVMTFLIPQMARMVNDLLSLLRKVLDPTVIIVKNTHHLRKLEGLPLEQPYILFDRRKDVYDSVDVSIPLIEGHDNPLVHVDLLTEDYHHDHALIVQFLRGLKTPPKRLLEVNTEFGIPSLILQSQVDKFVLLTDSKKMAETVDHCLICAVVVHCDYINYLSRQHTIHPSKAPSHNPSKIPLSNHTIDKYDLVTYACPRDWAGRKTKSVHKRLEALLPGLVRSVEDDGVLLISSNFQINELFEVISAVSFKENKRASIIAYLAGTKDRPEFDQPYLYAFKILDWKI